MGQFLWIWAALIALAVASIHHFGWEGIGIAAGVYLLMPWHPKA